MNGVSDDVLKKLYSLVDNESNWYADRLRDTSAYVDDRRPGAYSSAYAKLSDDLLNKYLNRKEFSYNPLTDSAFKSYENKMKREGQNAMREALANASALTGGYASSYAHSAANQAYRNYLEKLYDSVSDFENNAYSRYANETAKIKDGLEMVRALDDDAYKIYRDEMSDYHKDRDYYNEKYQKAQSEYTAKQKNAAAVLEKLATLGSNDFYKWMDVILKEAQINK